MSGMKKPSVPNKSGSGKPDERFFGTIGKSSGSASPASATGSAKSETNRQLPEKTRLFGTSGDENKGENEPNISSISANATRTTPNMGKRVNDSPGAMSRGKA